MIKEEKQYKFIKDIEAAKEIFKGLCCPNEFVECVGKNVFGVYGATIYVTNGRQKDLRNADLIGIDEFILKNDYEVQSTQEIMGSGELKSKWLREYQTKAIGKEYVDSLEEFLTQNVQTEVSKYRKLLEEQE